MTTQERFAADWGMPLEDVARMVMHAKDAGHANERACNGDPHSLSKDYGDKNENAKHWEAEVTRQAKYVAGIAALYGFTDVAFTGLFPCLKRGEQFVEIPY